MRDIKLPRLRATAEDTPRSQNASRADRQEQDASRAVKSCRHGSATPACTASPGAAPTMPQLKAVCADEAEILAMAIVRFIAAAAMTSDSACWDAAHDHADMHLGHHEGAVFVGAMAGLVRAVRIERTITWRFLPATCCRLTEDETDLARLLQAARARRENDLRDIARRITATAFPERLIESARRAAAAIAIVQARLAPADEPLPAGLARGIAETVH